MRRTRGLAAIGIAAAALLTLTACNAGSPNSLGNSSDESPLFEIADNVTVEGSPTFDRITKNGRITIGVKEDQPGLGYLDVTTGKRSGFDVDIARWIAASLGRGEDEIRFKPIASANREQAIVNGDIDYYVGTYSITDKRKQQIDFAGPYFLTGQGLLVTKDSPITSVDDLTDQTTVCSATGSTPIQTMRSDYPAVPTKEFDLYSACVEELLNGGVQAVTTDQAILLGYAARDSDALAVVGTPFTTEKYGVGLAKGDDALRAHINRLFTEGGKTWTAIYEKNLGSSGVAVEQPEVDAY